METPVKGTHSDADPESSPEFTVKAKRSNLDKMEEIKEAINSMKAQLGGLSGLKEKLDLVQSTVNEMNESMKQTLDSIFSRMNIVEEKCDEALDLVKNVARENVYLKTKLGILEENQLRAEAYSRRDNLLIDGIKQSENEDLVQKVRDVMKLKMKVDDADQIKFVRVHRLPSANTPQTTIVKFHYFPDKRRVWSKCVKLKVSNIWVDEDCPVEIRNRRQVLMPIWKAARNVEGMKAFLNGDKLVINNESYTIHNLNRLPPALKLQQTSLVSTDTHVYFYSRSSPLSNFFPCKTVINGLELCCSEQKYQLDKSEVNGDLVASDLIMSTSNPSQMKHYGDQIRVESDSRWTEGMKLKTMESACWAKFSQNRYLADVLLSTGDKTLVEASPRDDFWGASVPLKRLMEMPEVQWPGKNNLGKILEKICARLKSSNLW